MAGRVLRAVIKDDGKVRLAEPVSPKTPLRKKIGWHIGQDTIHSAVFDISPSDAQDLLGRNEGVGFRNRNLSEATVVKYQAEMLQRGWTLTGEPIIISRTGRLLNGQHRLHACVRANRPFQTLVVFGIEDSAFSRLDQGGKRTAANIFAIHGVGDYNRMAAATLWVWKYFHSGMSNPSGKIGGIMWPYPDQLYNFYKNEHPDLTKSLHVAAWFTSTVKLAPASLMVALHYLCSRADAAAAEVYFKKLATGIDVKRTDPALQVRNRLLEERVGGGKLTDIYVAAFVVMGWNATRERRRLNMLRWRTDAAKDLPFPKVI